LRTAASKPKHRHGLAGSSIHGELQKNGTRVAQQFNSLIVEILASPGAAGRV
jgi:hypothetical protein